jgi:hypothetical protein
MSPQIDIRKMAGSLAPTMAPEDLIPGDFVDMSNWIYDSDGLPMVRGGRRVWNAADSAMGTPTTGTVSGLYHFKQSQIEKSIQNWLIGSFEGNVYAASADGKFNAILTGALLGDKRPSFASLSGNLIMACESAQVRKLYKWTGTGSMERIEDSSPSSIVATYANRMWAVDRDDQSLLRFSALLYVDSWGQNPLDPNLSGGWLYVNPGDGNKISAMSAGFAGELLIFKDGPGGGAIYRLSGLNPDEFSVSCMSSTIGCLAPWLCTQVGDREVYFCSRRGIHSLGKVLQYGDLESSFIDREMSSKWRAISTRAKLQAVAVDDIKNGVWWLFLNSQGGTLPNDEGWLFHYRRPSPRRTPSISRVDFGANAACMFEDPTMKKDVLVTGGTEELGAVYTENHPEGSDETAALAGPTSADFAWSIQIAPIDDGDSYSMKSWKDLWLVYDVWGQSNFTVEWWGDNRYPSSKTISMNPAEASVPFTGGVVSGETRGSPDIYRGMNHVHLQEGGRALNIKISGAGGRMKLRGMRVSYDGGMMTLTGDQWFRYKGGIS